MNSVYDLLKEIKNLGARIYVVDDKIKLDIKKGILTNEISEKIKFYRDDLLTLIKDNSKPFEFSQIEKVPEQASYPISDGQRRLWVLSQFGDASVAYNMPEHIHINQQIDMEHFKNAIAATLERHEILRTVFKEERTGEVRQWIRKKEDINVALDYKDYRKEQNKQELVQAYIHEDSYKAFDLEHGPLLRVSLLQLEDELYVFYYNMHHIISDGWSMEVLTKDFFAYYEAYVRNEEPAVKELRIQYKDYSAWQLKQVNEESFKTHQAYWLENLKGELPKLDLPGIKQRPGVRTTSGEGLSTYIDKTTSSKLRLYSEEKGGSLFMGLLAAWNVLMYRYTGQQDIITGIPVAGREHADLADQIGFYINTLALRNEIGPEESFDELFLRVKQNTLLAYDHQVYPFDRLVEELNIKRDTSRSVVFDVLITFQNAGEKVQNHDRKAIHANEIKDLGMCTSKFDVSITFQEVGDEVSFKIVYNPDVYEKRMVESLMHHYKQLLHAILENTDEKIIQIDYLSPEEKQQLLLTFNDNKIDFPLNKTIIDLFEEQVVKTPGNIAVVFDNKQLTYSELNERSNQLAHYLKKNHAIGSGDLIGIMQDRSEWMIISILGVLKAGAAYIPVDPTYPAARKAFILEDTGVKIVLTQTDYIFDMDYYNGAIFAIDAQQEELLSFPSDTLTTVKGTSLAYVIYTSGSTGKPKGCGITHGNLSHYIQWANDYYFNESTRSDQHTNFCLYTSLSFDLTVTSIYCSLTQGGCIKVYAQYAETADILKDAFASDSGITAIKLTPSHINLLQHLDLQGSSMEIAIVGGEAVSTQHVKILKSINPQLKVYNEYGPTETTVGCIVKELQENEPVYIGKPMKGVRAYILGVKQELLPVGVAGEICIAGKGVGNGYLNRPKLSAEKFVDNPFVHGERMYKTGDTGRWLSTGEMEYLGRADEQVKIRGYRIELGEIEGQLNKYPSLLQSVVLAQANSNGEQELVAYMVSEEAIDITELRSYLNKQLPAYLVPAQYVQVESIPLTINAKVDKKQLQSVYAGNSLGRTEYVAPRNVTEEKLVLIWQEILGKENIGIRDNFFDLGGDSIKILRMMANMRRDLEIDTPIVDVYKYNTIESLQEYVFAHKDELESRSKSEKEAEAQVRAELEALKQRSVTLLQASGKNTENIADLYPMSDIEKGMIFESIVDTGKGIYHDQKVFQRSFVDFDTLCFENALKLMMEKHSVLRSSFHLEEFETEIKIVHKKINTPYEYIDLKGNSRQEQEEAVKAYMKKELERSFIINQAPLWRMTAFNFGANEVIFVFQCHHAIIDGWSETSFVAELNNIYIQLKENTSYQLAPLQSDYKDFIVEHELIRKNEAIRNFWKQELAGVTKLDLFTSENSIQEYGGAIDDQTYKQLKNLAQKNNVSIKVISLCAYMQLLKVLNYDQEIVSGLVTNMRPGCEDSDKILGCFLNTIPFRMEVDGTKTGVTFMNEIHEKLLNIKDKEKLSVLEIAQVLEKGSASGNPFFDVIFNYVDFHVLDSVKNETSEGSENELPLVNVDGQVLGNTYLDFSVDITGGLYRVHISLTRKLKSKFTADEIASLYFNMLRQLIQNPNICLNKLKHVTQAEEDQLLNVFNNTAITYPQETILHLVEKQVKKEPENAAIIYKGKTITYAALNEQSNQLAHYLRNKEGVKTNDLVGIQLSRTEWGIITMLGILKSGAAYVPIDPLYPQSRIEYMLKDSNCKLVFDEHVLNKFKKQQSHYPKNDLPVVNSMSDLAYVIYTSGSTGLPKGVMITHGSLADYTHTFTNTFNVTEKDRCIHQSSFSFDTHVEEIYPTLTKGGTLLMAGNGGSDIQELQQLIEQENATLLSATPIVLTELNALKPDTSSLRLLISGGDTFNASFVDHFLGKLEVYDSYGPSESTVCCTYHKVERIDTMAIIGRPINNRSIYILNKEDQLAPIGVTGEICIGGAGLARGYLNKPELTASKFVANPFKPGELMYRSGDLGRWLRDGTIEFAGRMDEQVKIRGYRIEKGEIENVLQQHPDISAAVVVVNSNNVGEKELTAYVVAKNIVSGVELRDYLNTILPVYMIPTHIIQLEQLPLTPNGKIDKKSLPFPEGIELMSEAGYIAPRNETEEQLVKVWQEVLQRENIGVTDDFFALGGHSLRAVRLRNQYEKRLSVKFSLKDLFTHTSIVSHVALIQASNRSEYIQIEKVAQQESYPVSDGQRRLWVLSQFEESSIAYNMPASIALEKNIDLESFKKAIDSTIERHEILRTVFKEDETGEVRQWIIDRKDSGFRVDYKDLRKTKNKEAAVELYIREDAAKAFDLAKGPLLRASLFQMGKDQYVFYFNMHHIISDGWSMEVLSKDVLSYYEAYNENKPVALKELGIQYKDYSSWALAQATEKSAEAHRHYWLESLSGELPLLDLPGSKQRPKIKSSNGQGLSVYLDAATSVKLKKYSEANGGSLFMGLLATWNILMYRYTGQKDIIIGSPVAGREHADLEDQIGFYVNTLALRNKIKPEENFNEFFSSVKQNTLNAYAHQLYAFDRLVEELELQRDTSRSGIFDVMFTLQNNGDKTSVVNLSQDELIAIADKGFHASKFDLELTVQELGAYLSIQVVFNSDVYEQEMVERLLRHYKQLLKAVLENPLEKIARIEYLSQAEKQELLFNFNDTEVTYPKNKTIIDLFKEQAVKVPNAIALVIEDRKLTYRELHEQSNQLAAYLQKNYAIKPNDLVGIKLDRTEWMIIAVLAVLKSGGAYVPIDPAYPQERIDYMEQDINCKVCIDSTELNTFKKNQKKYLNEKVISRAKPDDLAYVIYTSGSTGKPKGVMIEQKSVIRLVKNTNIYPFSSSDKLLCTGALSFDATTFEYWGPLLNGGQLVLCSQEILLDSKLLKEEIKSKAINIMWFTSGWLNQLVESEISIFSTLHTIITGGDKLSAIHIKKLRKKHPELNIINGYGPTENTTFSTTYDILEVDTTIPIGKPINNTQVYIISEEEGLQPIGITGEICLGGDGLARGYLNQPALTSGKFIANPFKEDERIYKTGDLGKWLPDGTIEFIGRKDDQVKIRGYRIELGEIEHALQKHTAIEAAVVLAKENQNKEKELVAYITAGAEQNISELRSYLKTLLPDYMLPAHFVQLQALPLNSNGKVDKKALPDPPDSYREAIGSEGSGLSSGVEYIAPRNAQEEKLVEIWEEILKKKNIGIQDDFFALGGHSLKAVRLKNQYQKKLSANFSLKDLFEHTSILSHAALMKGSSRSEYIQIEKVVPQASYPISDGQRRLWVLCQFEQSSIAYNMPASLVLEKNIDVEIFKRAIAATMDRHEILRTLFKEDETGEIRQWIVDRTDLDFQIAFKDFRKTKNKDTAVQQYIYEDSVKAFDLEKGPLLRASLLQVAKDRYVFYFNMHHIISDGWSMEVIFKDVISFYESMKKNEQPVLKALRIQYKDYSAWALAQLTEESFKAHREYWLNKLGGTLPLLELPGTKKRPKIKTYTGNGLSTYIDKTITVKLKKYSESNGGSLFMGLLAAWNILMYNYTGQKDIIIGSPVAGRDHADLEDQIGFYVNTLALRNEIDPEESFDTFFRRLKDNTLKSYSHQMYPFDRLVEELELQRDTSRSAVFDMMLILQNNGEKRGADDRIAAGLERITVDAAHTTSKFDIDIAFHEAGDYLSFSIVYNPDVYEREVIEGLINHYKQLLNALLENPHEKISEIDFLSQEEKQQLLITFNDTAVSYPKNKTIIDLFEEQVRKTPDHIAVVCEDKELSYQELHEQSNQFAHYLQQNYAIGPDDFVGIKQERSEWMIISVLAVLKSGGAYVPIDMAYPQERIDYIEKDTSCKVCIDSNELMKFRKDQKKYSKKTVNSKTRVSDLAYVIYTSGSTGRPKGVLIEHKNAYAFIKWCHDEFRNSAVDTVLFTTSLNFDLSVFEIFYTLTTGKEIKVLKDGLSIPKNLDTNKRQLINTVPSVVGFLLQQEMSFDTVSVLNMAGEPIPANYRTAIKGKVKEIRNLYGPSEDTTYSTFIRIDQDERELIGKPISNTQVYILNDADKLTPLGVVGEICISGDGLARGYLNQEELTNAKFVNNPFKKGERLYKTGDLGRWLPDGNIDFLGRKDNQVKIRGYRIELGEIEHALQSYAAIEGAVVLARENQNKEKELVAYITAKSEQTTNELRAYLKEMLPEYMLPAHFVQLDALPLTANGKVDKKSLPDPEGLGLASGIAYAAPRNETEEQLVKIWEEVLQKDNIGIHDDFFALGGHSLRVIRLRNLYQKKLSVNFPLKDLFTHTSIVSHAEVVLARRTKVTSIDNNSAMISSDSVMTATSSMFSLSEKKATQAKNMYFIPPVTGTSILYKPLVQQFDKNYNCYGFEYTGLESGASFFESIEQAASAFSREIIQQETNKELLIFAYSMGASIAFEMVKMLEKNNRQVQLILLDATVKQSAQKPNLSAINKEVKILMEAYKKLNMEANINEKTLKKFLVNNFKIHEQYKHAGKIKSDILLFEARNNPIPTDMKKWKKLTAGAVNHLFIEGGHWDMLSSENLPVYKTAVLEHFPPVLQLSAQIEYSETIN
jgi:amino acid adenylation domain-containing protein